MNERKRRMTRKIEAGVLAVVIAFTLGSDNAEYGALHSSVPGVSELLKSPEIPITHWNFTSIDTMKLSRDMALNQALTPEIISREIGLVKSLGATHVAIGTPYDEEFLPVLKNWVSEARRNDLSVWFRGNFSAFEYQDKANDPSHGWFGYVHDNNYFRHLEKTHEFITAHPDLFRAGDIFTPWPEPENSFPDPSGSEFSSFLINSYEVCDKAFFETGKSGVEFGYFSMNGDVALSLSPDTVRQIGNKVVIDHYVKEPFQMGEYLKDLNAKFPNAEIILGEFGGPIPDLNGEMTELQQATFVKELLRQIAGIPSVVGVNYWGTTAGSTEIFNDDGTQRMAAEVIRDVYVKNERIP